jgi:hypothetical protein
MLSGPDYSSPEVSSLYFDKLTLSLGVGGMDMIGLKIDPADLQGNLSIEWSYDPSVIRIDKDNYTAVITALSQGETILRATTAGLTTTCVVSVSGNAAERVVTNPYVYSSVDLVTVAPGETSRVTASLYGGTSADTTGFTFSIDKPSIAGLAAEGNYAWLTGSQPGIARVTIQHNKAAYSYSFLVSCQSDTSQVPYLTTSSNIITINKAEKTEVSLMVDLMNPPAASYDGALSWALRDQYGSSPADPPVSIAASGRQCLLTALKKGECYVSVSHPDAPYPLDVLVRVIEELENVYIEPSASVVYVTGSSSQMLTASLANVPPNVTSSLLDFSWSFSAPDYYDYIDSSVFGGSSQGTGDTLWITGKKIGSLKATISHPLAVASRDVLIVIKDLSSSAASAATYITTSHNYIAMTEGGEASYVSIYVNNAAPGDEQNLHWSILNTAQDGSGDPVVSYVGGTGTSSSASSRAVSSSLASGNAVISPLKEGSATITISHPKAVYDTKILVTVLAAGSAVTEPLSLTANTSMLRLKNGSSGGLSVSLNGRHKQDGDENDIHWQASSAAISLCRLPSATSFSCLILPICS